MWVNFKPFSDEHQTYKETQSFSSGGMYPLVSSLERKAENYINNIALLADATARDCKEYAKLATTVASLTTKLVLAKIYIVESLRENTRL